MMKNYFRNLFSFSGEGREEMKNPSSGEALFILFYKDIHIGELEYKNDKWFFSYSPVFKRQREIKPLFSFPDLDKEYASVELWPFFAARIPGMGQPAARKTIEKEGLDETNIVALLQRFGKHTISNPYRLEAR